MNDQIHIDPGALIDEIIRYLTVVEAFRAAGCEPFWHPERGANGVAFAAPAVEAPTVSAH